MPPATGLGLEPIRQASLVDEAYRQIKSLILTGRLRPGAALKDSVLADQMGVSRSPVREALRLLEHAGLVEKAANRSYRISVLAAEEVPELAALRCADEVVAVRTIVRNGTSVTSLESALDAIRRADGDPDAGATADAAFHAAVVKLAALPRLTARYRELNDQIRLVLLSGDVASWGSGGVLIETHTQLYDALRAAVTSGDAGDAVRAWESHICAGMGVPGLLPPL